MPREKKSVNAMASSPAHPVAMAMVWYGKVKFMHRGKGFGNEFYTSWGCVCSADQNILKPVSSTLLLTYW